MNDKAITETQAIFKVLVNTISKTGSYTSETDFLIDSILAYDEQNDELDNELKISTFRKSLIDCVCRTEKIKDDFVFGESVVQHYRKACSQLLRNLSRYRLVTTISCSKDNLIPKRRSIEGCQLSFYKELPKELAKQRAKIFNLHKEDYSPVDEQDFLYVSITTQAPNARTAVNRAMDALSIYRALANRNFTKHIHLMPPKYSEAVDSKSRIRVGDYHTLQNRDVNQVLKCSLWYEVARQRTRCIKQDTKSLDKLLTKDLKYFRDSPIREHLKKTLIVYIEALDSDNKEVRFTKLWTAFEILLKTHETRELVKRISSFFENKALIKEKIEASRKARNRVTHAGISGQDFSLKCYELLNIFEVCFIMYLKNPFKFKNIDEFTKFVSTPRQLTEIDKQIELLQVAKRYCRN